MWNYGTLTAAAAAVPLAGANEILVLDEEFDTFDHDLWKHEITMVRHSCDVVEGCFSASNGASAKAVPCRHTQALHRGLNASALEA